MGAIFGVGGIDVRASTPDVVGGFGSDESIMVPYSMSHTRGIIDDEPVAMMQ